MYQSESVKKCLGIDIPANPREEVPKGSTQDKAAPSCDEVASATLAVRDDEAIERRTAQVGEVTAR